MLKRQIFIYSFVVMACSSSSVFAEGLSLQEALETAGQSSPYIQRSNSQHEEAYWKKVESYSAFLPTISGSAQYISTYKYLLTDITEPAFGPNALEIPGIFPTTTYQLEATLNIFDGFASTARLQSAKLMEKSAQENLDWTRFKASREVILQFYKALAAKILSEVAEANLKTLEDHLKDVELLKKSGLSTNYDVLRVEVQHSEASSEVLNAKDEIETATGRLAEILGADQAAEPKGQLPELGASVIEKMDLNSRSLRPDLQAMQDQVEALQFQKNAANAHWFPKVNLFGSYLYYDNLNDRAFDWGKFRNSYQVGVNLSWTFFEGFKGVAKTREAIEQRTQSEKTFRIAQLKAGQDAAVWKRKYKYFISIYKARQSDIGKAQESVRLAKEGRRVGSRTTTELLDAETDLFRSKAGAVNAQMGIIEALINLELATGQKLYEFN